MGKFLEASALGHGDDVYFFQELAEAAARSEWQAWWLWACCISHSPNMGPGLGTGTRDDWAKVQGRYVDLPFVAASDEVVELIGRAIEARTQRPPWMQEGVQRHRGLHPIAPPLPLAASSPKALATCWPLHPAMAALLGPISKRQFGQNERSTFGFLASVEPHGFHSYLKRLQSSQPRGIARTTIGTTCARTLSPRSSPRPMGTAGRKPSKPSSGPKPRPEIHSWSN
jgi:hypothetical protein